MADRQENLTTERAGRAETAVTGEQRAVADDERIATDDERIATDDEREAARRRVTARRDLTAHVVAYVVINAFLVGVWALTGRGYFWPAWVLGAWGIGLVLHAWDVLFRRPVTAADVDAELRRHREADR